MKLPFFWTFWFCALLLPQSVFADHLPSPQGRVLLTLSGQISHTNASGKAHFDRDMLERLPQATVVTATPWTEGKHRYDGVLLKDLLAHVGATGQRILARALNDYYAEFRLPPIADYPVLLALKADGHYMKVRNKGPIWIIYPLSDAPELDTNLHHNGMVWQLRQIEVRE